MKIRDQPSKHRNVVVFGAMNVATGLTTGEEVLKIAPLC